MASLVSVMVSIVSLLDKILHYLVHLVLFEEAELRFES